MEQGVDGPGSSEPMDDSKPCAKLGVGVLGAPAEVLKR